MNKKIYLIAGLPRSGSTLLCNLLLQNPDFFATSTSSLIDLILQLRDNWNNFQGHKTNASGQNKWKVIRAVIDNYHNTERMVIFDKNREWTNNIEFLEKVLGYEVKVICCVRNLEDILSSFEKLYRKNRAEGEIHGEFSNLKMKTLEGRCEVWSSEGGVLGKPYIHLKDVFDRGLSNRVKLLPYEFFVENPELSIKEIYKWINYDYFEHDFKNIKQVVHEDDLGYGWGKDLHTIKEGSIKPQTSDSKLILGEKLTEMYSNKEFWKKL